MYDALVLTDLVADELRQRRETGHDVTDLAARARAETDETELHRILAELDALERRDAWPYVEPDDLDGILAELPAEPDSAEREEPLPAGLRDRVHGAWLGRVAGCMLGKPLEKGDHWTPERIRDYLERAGAYPLEDYVPVLDPQPTDDELSMVPGRDGPHGLHWSWPVTTRGRIAGAARDDDIDYTVLNLQVLEGHGPGFTTEDVGQAWLRSLPCLQTYTAERAAYRNLIDGLRPPQTAIRRNPYREWIGAAIRADVFGYVHPGRPRAAALMAYRDARLSHTGNGIYAEMWLAALVSLAFVEPDPQRLLTGSLAYVPPCSRLAEALHEVLDSHRRGRSWEEALREVRRRHGHYTWVHAVNNACLVAAGLLWGAGDWVRAVGLTVQAGWDTDSNGATAGSVMGAALGAAAVPDRFAAPLADTVRPGLFGMGPTRITELAARTSSLAERFAAGR